MNSQLNVSYEDVLHTRTIQIEWNTGPGIAKGLVAKVSDLKLGMVVDNLPVCGIPSQLLKDKNVQTLAAFLKNAHYIPEKGVDGSYNRVTVHITGLGGGKKPIPFQPGLALGSVVNGKTIDALESYANAMAETQNLEDQMRNTSGEIEHLQLKIEARIAQFPALKPVENAPHPKGNILKPPAPAAPKGQELAVIEPIQAHAAPLDQLVSRYTDRQLKAWDIRIQRLQQHLTALEEDCLSAALVQLPMIKNFQAGASSPIDMANSKIECQPRAFETLDFSSQYIDMSESDAEIHNKASQTSSTLSVTQDSSFLVFKTSAKVARAEAIAKKVLQLKKQGIAQGTLVINVSATTRHVRCFTKIEYLKEKLEQILSVMHANKEKELERYGISVPKDGGEKAIYVLTESVMGAALTIFVTFYKDSKTTRNQDNQQTENSLEVGASATVGASFLSANVGGLYSRDRAERKEDDVLKSSAQTRVNIEISSEGALPSLESSRVEREVVSHVNMDPAKFERSKQSEAELEKISKCTSKEELQTELGKRSLRMKEAQENILNTMRGLTFLKEEQKVHTMESAIKAYESFIHQVTSDPSCGVPVGFNYDILTQKEIEKRLGKKENS